MESELLFGMETENQVAGTVDAGTGSVETESLLDPTLVDPTAVVGSLKRRRPQVKLTGELLVGERGLPYVMKHAPRRIRISKRRTAHDNLSHIIQFYQLWAHDLFPKARFDDFVKLCQSLGKSDKILREYRKNVYLREIYGTNVDAEALEVEGQVAGIPSFETPVAETAAQPAEAESIESQTTVQSAEAAAQISEVPEAAAQDTEVPGAAAQNEDDPSQAMEEEQYLDTQEVFEEDEEALRELREMGL